jgi:hypothetical protein
VAVVETILSLPVVEFHTTYVSAGQDCPSGVEYVAGLILPVAELYLTISVEHPVVGSTYTQYSP